MSDVTSPIEILKKLTDSKNQGGKVQLWDGTNQHLSKTPMLLNQIKTDDDTLLFRPQEESLIILEDLLKERSFLNIYLPQGSYLFQVRWKHHDRNGNVGTYFPDLLRFIERRTSDRLYPERFIKIKFKEQQKSCYDLSVEGLSVVFTKSEISDLSVGDKFPAVLLYDALEINLNLEVTTVTKIKPFIFENLPYGHKKMGLKITELKPKDAKKLDALLNFHKEAFQS
ncbi:MAG: hypothetical protein HN509_04230 [Halobacteriovoraceae bacterium]|jgi:hypothetical protein|nr:hypothetical protein [Halobacteriovoraceae bacterium]MBT5093787.1 hypothetical protein [Halobacteriovoraceae bacterium]